MGPRKAPMNRGKPMERKPPVPRPTVTQLPKPHKPRDPEAAGTPLPLKLRLMVIERSRCPETGEVLCDWCGDPITGAYSAHHRLPGRMGGRRGKHTAAVVVIVDGTGTTGHHGYLESHRTEALARGFLIPDGAGLPPPEEYPLLLHGRKWVIPGDGVWHDAEPLAA